MIDRQININRWIKTETDKQIFRHTVKQTDT